MNDHQDQDQDHKEKKIWRTQDGREIPIHLLEDQHLASIIRMLAKDVFVKVESTIWSMMSYAYDAPDGAHDAVEGEIRELQKLVDEPVETRDVLKICEAVYDQWSDLWGEARARNLAVGECFTLDALRTAEKRGQAYVSMLLNNELERMKARQ